MSRITGAVQLEYRCFSSVLGWILLAASPEGIRLVHFCGSAPPSAKTCEGLLTGAMCGATAFSCRGNPLLSEAEEAIRAYLTHHQRIPSLPLDLRAGTSFQRQVWRALRSIPFGQTRSYLQVAQSIGQPQSARPVGQACGKNPIPIFVPCHRVISANGRLGGFSSGLHIKEALLAIEDATWKQD